MVNAAVTMMFSVLTFYSIYKYIFQQIDQFREASWVHLQWEFMYIASTLMGIYTASRVSSEVSIHTQQPTLNFVNLFV